MRPTGVSRQVPHQAKIGVGHGGPLTTNNSMLFADSWPPVDIAFDNFMRCEPGGAPQSIRRRPPQLLDGNFSKTTFNVWINAIRLLKEVKQVYELPDVKGTELEAIAADCCCNGNNAAAANQLTQQEVQLFKDCVKCCLRTLHDVGSAAGSSSNHFAGTCGQSSGTSRGTSKEAKTHQEQRNGISHPKWRSAVQRILGIIEGSSAWA